MGAAACGFDDVHQVSLALGGGRASFVRGELTMGIEAGVTGDGAGEVWAVVKVSLM